MRENKKLLLWACNNKWRMEQMQRTVSRSQKLTIYLLTTEKLQCHSGTWFNFCMPETFLASVWQTVHIKFEPWVCFKCKIYQCTTTNGNVKLDVNKLIYLHLIRIALLAVPYIYIFFICFVFLCYLNKCRENSFWKMYLTDVKEKPNMIKYKLRKRCKSYKHMAKCTGYTLQCINKQ